jgi:protein SCO1
MAASPAMVRFRVILWTLVIVAAIGATLLFVFKPVQAPGGVTGTPFTLQSTAGGTFSNNDLKGTPSLVFFGYTFCPDVCPTTMAELANWKRQLGLTDQQVRTIFITVDPHRDTLAVLKDYVGNFDPGIIGLVGDDTQTAAAKASFGASSENQAPDKDGNYLVNHTASVFLMDRAGQFVGTIDYGDQDAQASLAKIKRLAS